MAIRPPTNMRVLLPSRARRRPGDVFAYQMPDDLFRFGRLVSVTARIGPMRGVHLVYFYKGAAISTALPLPQMRPTDLLVAPVLVNQQPWTLGYFQRVAAQPLAPDDILPVHCFRMPGTGKYFDDRNQPLRAAVEPCGVYGLNSYRTVDDELSAALGFQQVPG
jgi:hypothetical protein